MEGRDNFDEDQPAWPIILQIWKASGLKLDEALGYPISDDMEELFVKPEGVTTAIAWKRSRILSTESQRRVAKDLSKQGWEEAVQLILITLTLNRGTFDKMQSDRTRRGDSKDKVALASWTRGKMGLGAVLLTRDQWKTWNGQHSTKYLKIIWSVHIRSYPGDSVSLKRL
eukprot:g53081.t1